MNRFICFSLLLCCFGNVIAQQTEYVDFKKATATLTIKPDSLKVSGFMTYTFDILKHTDSIFIDAVQMNFDNVVVWNEQLEDLETFHRNLKDKLVIVYPFERSKTYKLFFNFSAEPKKALYFNKINEVSQIWTQGQGKYTSNWLPSIDDVNDKIEFDITLLTDPEFEALANGKLVQKGLDKEKIFWSYDMQKPMSSYLVALAIGKYHKKTQTSKSGIPLEYYYYPEDSLSVEPTYRYAKEIFDFFEEEIGFPYPWQNYKQVPVKDFLYSGMENTCLTLFSDGFVVDSIAFNDKNYITVNAHELAHQWFGDLVTAKSGEHHWLQEGFATYYALLAERHLFGEHHYYWQLYENAQELIAQESAGQSTSLLDPKSSSTTFYKKGAWALHVLREKVGDTAFRSAVQNYLEKHQFENVETRDFISEVENTSGQDLTAFVNDWLIEVKLPEDVIVKSLKQSSFMQEYFMVDCEVYSSKCKDYLSSNISDQAKVKVISQIPDKIDTSAFQNSLRVRQAIAQYVSSIPENLKPNYESLLNDKSYVTIEAALYNLWVNFPLERSKYLEKTKHVIGFNDCNVRLLWLALHLNTLEYQPQKKQEVLNALIAYSLSDQDYELRMKAFNYLKLLDVFESKSIASLIDATTHHNWRFSKYAKDLLEELKMKNQYKTLIEQALKNQ